MRSRSFGFALGVGWIGLMALIVTMAWYLPAIPQAAPPVTVQEQIMARTGLIMDGEGQGTVTLVRRGGVVWGLTCAHCTNGNALRVKVFNPDALLDAELVVRSDDEDLAVIRVPSLARDLPDFRMFPGTPMVGLELVHVGNFYGQLLPLSYSTGVFSGTDRNIEGQLYDQTTVTALPGSSGGGVYTKDGQYVGMIARGMAASVNGIIPARHVRLWATTHNVDFIFEPTLRVPLLPTSQPASQPEECPIGIDFPPHRQPRITLPFWR